MKAQLYLEQEIELRALVLGILEEQLDNPLSSRHFIAELIYPDRARNYHVDKARFMRHYSIFYKGLTLIKLKQKPHREAIIFELEPPFAIYSKMLERIIRTYSPKTTITIRRLYD